ncbi:MAG: GNAT family N-acetyltransferase [Planctomycetes bacterium]|jgi:putative acetyltransferase|nr:GNAT family N-acetyltransferase [Planctomycetota bacterium]
MSEPAPIWLLRPIRPGDDAAMADIIRTVMTEHGCAGPGFAIHDAEVAAMSAAYRAPGSGYYVVEHRGQVHGGAGFGRLQGTTREQATCELRKMYFRPTARGLGLGQALLALLLDEMRAHGYRRCYLETTDRMQAAQRLYRAAGFVPQCSAEGATGHHGCDTFYSRPL